MSGSTSRSKPKIGDIVEYKDEEGPNFGIVVEGMWTKKDSAEAEKYIAVRWITAAKHLYFLHGHGDMHFDHKLNLLKVIGHVED